MPKQTRPMLFVLILLVMASLACATVMGGPSASDVDATAQSIEDTFEATAAAAEATADATLNGDDPGDDGEDPGDDGEDPGDDGEDPGDDGDDTDGGDYEFADDGPDSIPLFAAESDVNIAIADSANLIYDVDAEVDEVADFYREAMEDLGWELAPNGDFEALGTVTLQYNRDGQTAILVIAAFTGPTTVTATVS